MSTWIPLNRNVSPTKASTDIAAELPKAVILGQGRETNEPQGDIGKFLRGQIEISSKYNAAVGGPDSLREAAAYWAKRFLGIPATKETVFVLQQLGRVGLREALLVAGAIERPSNSLPPILLMPRYGWPMVDEQAQDANLRMLHYDANAISLARNIDDSVLHREISAIYLNYPHNSTGAHISLEENKAVTNLIETGKILNANGEKTMRIDDNPYFMACPTWQGDNKYSYLQSGYNADVLPTEKGSVPWVHILSFSKALATANTGLSVVVCHPSLAPTLRARFTRSVGLAYNEAFFNGVQEIFNPAFDQEILQHFANLREKYKINRYKLQDIFKTGLGQVVQGGVSMTSLMQLPPALAGRLVPCHDGVSRLIKDTNDVVEYLANRGVVVVNNGNDLKGGLGHIRFAQAQHQNAFEDGVTRAKAALEEIANSPMGPA
jgi:aspartate/methionine/tyrosine aminotransferase